MGCVINRSYKNFATYWKNYTKAIEMIFPIICELESISVSRKVDLTTSRIARMCMFIIIRLDLE